MMRIVVIGGRGNFGRRICRTLAGEPDMEVIAAGRTRRLDDVKSLEPGAAWAALDLADSAFGDRLKRLKPNLVIHCAGPFQGQSYAVALAAADAGAHYIDLADGRAFVSGFCDGVDAAARAAGVSAITGASTLPALSSAVVDDLSKDMVEIVDIRSVIAPAQHAPRGAATLAAVFSYAGKPFDCLVDGQMRRWYGWQHLRRVHIHGLQDRWAAACDVPDLAVFVQRYPKARTVMFHAALEVGVQHAGLWLVAALRRMGIPLQMEKWAALLDRTASMLDVFGSELGGMRVDVVGKVKDGSLQLRAWHIAAARNHGPEIPCMAAILLARKMACGGKLPVGALVCMGLLSLEDFAPEFQRWGMQTITEAEPLELQTF